MKRMISVACVILAVLIASPAFAQIIGERPVSTPVSVPTGAFGEGSIASDGTHFLAAWIDSRRYAIYATRIDSDGKILDSYGILVAGLVGNTDSVNVGVVWSGDSYLLIWNTQPDDAPTSVMAARIDSGGRVIDPAHIILPGTRVDSSPFVATNGSVNVVVTRGGYSVLDNDLRIAGSGTFNSVPWFAHVYSIAAGGFTLIGSGVRLRLDAGGHSADSGLIADQGVACHGTGCIQLITDSATVHHTAPYDPATGTLGPENPGIPLNGYCDVAATADGYLLFSNDGVVQRLDGQGRPLGPFIGVGFSASDRADITAASNGRDVALLIWNPYTYALSVTLVTPTAVTDLGNVGASANSQSQPKIASSGANYLVAWTESDGVYAGRVSLDGTPLDGRGTLVSRITAPQVAYDGASYLVSGEPLGGGLTTIARIDPATGATLSVQKICGSNLRMAGNGTSHIAVWVDCSHRIVTAFVDANGVPASTPVPLSPDSSQAAYPEVAWNGSLWLVTWEEQGRDEFCTLDPQTCGLTTVAIRGARFSAALTPIDTTPITISEDSRLGGVNGDGTSRLASDGHDFLAAWNDDYGAVYTRHISASGEALDDRQLPMGDVQDLVWDGAEYDLACHQDYSLDHLMVVHLRSSGEAFETFVLSASADIEPSASLVSPANGRVVAAFTRLSPEPLYGGVERVFVTTPHPARVHAVR